MRTSILMKGLVAAGLVIGISACGEGQSTAGNSADSNVEGSFSIDVSNGSGFSDASDRARVEAATDRMFGFKARGWHLRVNARAMPDAGPAETTEFGGNNTMLTLYVEVDGKRRRVGCDPADPEIGTFNRTKLTDTQVSGEFTLEFVSCEDYMSAELVEVPGLPLTVTGTFTDIARTDQ